VCIVRLNITARSERQIDGDRLLKRAHKMCEKVLGIDAMHCRGEQVYSERLLIKEISKTCSEEEFVYVVEGNYDPMLITGTQYHNPVMNVNVKITRFCNWLQSM
jgi:hypothetical protein